MDIKYYLKNDNKEVKFETDEIKDWEKIGFVFKRDKSYGPLYGFIPEGWTYKIVSNPNSPLECIIFYDQNGFKRAGLDIEHKRSGNDNLKYGVNKRFSVNRKLVGVEVVVFFGDFDNPLFIAGHVSISNKEKLAELEEKARKFGEEFYPNYEDVTAYWDNEPRKTVDLNEYIENLEKENEKESRRKFRDNQLSKGKEALSRAMSGEQHVIENMEEEGQQETITGIMMAKDMRPSREAWEKLGFTFKDIEGDNVLCQAVLPEGWILVPTNHPMWNEIYDDKDRLRGRMFYKSSFYDRSAHMSLISRYSVMEKPVGQKQQDGLIYFGNDEEILFEAGIVQGLYNFGLDNDARIQINAKEANLLAEARAYGLKNYPDFKNIDAYWDLEPNKTL